MCVWTFLLAAAAHFGEQNYSENSKVTFHEPGELGAFCPEKPEKTVNKDALCSITETYGNVSSICVLGTN